MFTVTLLLQRTFNLLVPCNNSGHTPTYNTDGRLNCLRQPGQLRNQLHKSITIICTYLLSFCTVTNPAAETKSMGLPSDALLLWFLHRHQDNFIVTGQLASVYRD
jgi:hypothetical protein